MPQICDTYDINANIAHIIEDARKHIVIISPFIKINRKMQKAIELADRRGVRLFLIYGKTELDESTAVWVRRLRNSSLGYIRNLHAKIIMNEDFAVMSSMNLYEYSQVNNEELGAFFGRREDRAAFKDIVFQVLRLIRLSEKEYGGWDISELDRPIRSIFKRNTPINEFLVPEEERAMIAMDSERSSYAVYSSKPTPADGMSDKVQTDAIASDSDESASDVNPPEDIPAGTAGEPSAAGEEEHAETGDAHCPCGCDGTPSSQEPDSESDDGSSNIVSNRPRYERRICYCIRCGRRIPSDHQYVYCGRCMSTWGHFANVLYIEPAGRCYICGRSGRYSADKPACAECYLKNADLVDDKRYSMRCFRR